MTVAASIRAKPRRARENGEENNIKVSGYWEPGGFTVAAAGRRFGGVAERLKRSP